MQWSDLKVRKQAHTLVLEIYSITSSFPKSEIYGITNQLRRASSSIATNIVEGQSRNSTKDYVHFLYISRGSLEETRYFLLLSRDLGYLPTESYHQIETVAISVSKLMNGLIASLKPWSIIRNPYFLFCIPNFLTLNPNFVPLNP